MGLGWGCSCSLGSTFNILLVYCFLLAMRSTSTSATEFSVGAKNWWTLPKDTSYESLDHWAQRNRFQVGDTLLFFYDPKEDSVLLVCEEDYNNCKTSEPLQSFKDGNTSFKLDRSGSFYFISGNSERCKKSEKLHVKVMATRKKATKVTPSPAPKAASVAPAPSPSEWGNEPSPSPSPSVPKPTATNGVEVKARIWPGVGGSAMTIVVALVCYMFFI